MSGMEWTDAEREAVRDALAHTTIGTGYYSTTVGIDEAREMTDDVLDALAPRVAALVRAERAATLREAADYCTPENWTGPAATLIHLNDWLRVSADRVERGES